MFNTFYDNYIEYGHYVNHIPQNISSNKEIGKGHENENKSQQSKIKVLQQEIQNLKNKNKNLKVENNSQLKTLELPSVGHNRAILHQEITLPIIQHRSD